jgi:hypothetical protein
MAMHWNHLHDFILLNLVRFSPTPGSTRSRIWLPAFLNTLNARWPEPYETTALGYEASWAGVFPDRSKEVRQ